MDENLLESLGLSKNEAKVYMALMEQGPSATGVISKAAKVHRTNAYEALDRLATKGLVAYFMKGETKYFEAADPSHLLHLLKEREDQLKKMIPEFKIARKIAGTESVAKVIDGVDAFMGLMYGFLDCKEDILIYGIPKIAPEIVKTKIPHFHKLRIQKKISMKHIYNHNAQERITYLNSLPFTEAKYLPEQFDSHVSTMICGDEVLFTLWATPLKTILIKDQVIADAYKRYFHLLYDIAKQD
ncbi:hypothetical protein HZB02_02355 [Candidatus Woesearchaeota archaeon]|nr:hypothetical protein [Candidatus Woesearchaeota archaeon]